MNFKGTAARDAGEAILAATPWRIGNERLFCIVAHAFYGEADRLGRAPSFDLTQFGHGLGLEAKSIGTLRSRERERVDAARRASLGGSRITSKRYQWVLEDGTRVVR